MNESFLQTSCGNTVVLYNDFRDNLDNQQSGLAQLVCEAVCGVKIPTGNKRHIQEMDMGRTVGFATCVEAEKILFSQKTLFAKQSNHQDPSRVILETKKTTTSIITVKVCWNENVSKFVLSNAFVGRSIPVEPYDCPDFYRHLSDHDPKECCVASALAFWQAHAIVWDQNTMTMPKRSSWSEVLDLAEERRKPIHAHSARNISF